MHKNYYDFFDAEKIVKEFISNVENKFVSRGKVEVQGSVEVIKYQSADEIDQLIELESRRTWLADVYICVYFNVYVKKEISKSLMKRVIINGMTGSSQHFKDLNVCLLLLLL